MKLTPADNPYSDYSLGHQMTIEDFLNAQKAFYLGLQDEYRNCFRRENGSNIRQAESIDAIKKSRRSLNLGDFVYTGKDPTDLEKWSHAKRLDFERKKLMKL